MIADRQHLSMTGIAEVAAVVSAFFLAWMSSCEAQSFAIPGRAMRTGTAPTQQAPLSPGPLSVPAAKALRTDLDWGQLFKKQVERCWKKPADDGHGGIEAIFSIKLKRDGMLEAVHMISSVDTTPYGKAYQTSSFRAIMDCQPYHLPQNTYDQWRFFEPVFTGRRAR
jgi:hypothetical protein